MTVQIVIDYLIENWRDYLDDYDTLNTWLENN